MSRLNIGDTIEADTQSYRGPAILRVTLDTQAGLDLAQKLIDDPQSGWRIQSACVSSPARGQTKGI